MELNEDTIKAQQMVDQVSTLVRENPDAAASLVKRAMSMSAGLGDAWGIAEGLEATAAVRSDNAARSAVTLAAAANQLRERVSMRPHPFEARINRRHLDQARGQLSADGFEESWEEGCSMTPEKAIDLALG